MRLAVTPVAEFGALDLQKVAEGLAGCGRSFHIEDGIGMNRVFEVRLPPRETEAAPGAEAPERQVECRDLKFMIEGTDRMLIERLGGGSGISIAQRIMNAFVR